MTADAAAAPGRPERLPRRRTVTRQRLIAAAHDVFVERGIRDTPIEVICERAGFTRGAFYSNFDSKEDLFLAVYREFNGDRVRRFATAAGQAFPPGRRLGRARMRTAIAEAAGLFAEHLVADQQWYLLTLEFRLQGLRQPELGARLDQANAQLRGGLGEVVTGVLERTGLRLRLPVPEAVDVLVALYDMNLEHGMLAAASGRAVEQGLPAVILELISNLFDSPADQTARPPGRRTT